MEVRELIGGNAHMCDSDTAMAAAAETMVREGVGSLGVRGREGLSGIVTERDVLRAAAAGADLSVENVTDWMTPNPDTVPSDMTVEDAAIWMVAAGYRHLPVVDDGDLLGVASIKDVLWAITEQHLRNSSEG